MKLKTKQILPTKASFILVAFFSLFGQSAFAQTSGDYPMKIKITNKDNVIIAVLNNSPASKDLAASLPVTLEMHMHENREYYGDIDLSTTGTLQDNYEIGDIAYWTPGRVLVIYYGPGRTGSLIKMGSITDGLDQLPLMGKKFTAIIEKI